MTDLPNRRAFHLAADAIFTRARRLRRPVGAVMIDLDHFKRLNDTYGHLVGDEIVRAVAGRMRSAVAADDVVARFGGDEFAVLLYGADITTTRTVANRVRSAVIGSPIKTEHGPVYVTLSLGVAATDGSRGSTLEGLIHDADQALYKAKRAGRDRVEVAEPYEEAPA
jgi:diguanylate cyclase (GGDEF)-like protein